MGETISTCVNAGERKIRMGEEGDEKGERESVEEEGEDERRVGSQMEDRERRIQRRLSETRLRRNRREQERVRSGQQSARLQSDGNSGRTSGWAETRQVLSYGASRSPAVGPAALPEALSSLVLCCHGYHLWFHDPCFCYY